MVHRSLLIRFVVVAMMVATPFAAFAGGVARPGGGGSSFDWQVTAGPHDRIELRITDPNGEVHTRSFKYGKAVSVRLSDLGEGIDGVYNYELVVIPNIPGDVAKKLQTSRASGDEAAARKIMRDAGLREPTTQSGGFRVMNGAFVTPNAVESDANDSVSAAASNASRGAGAGTSARPGDVTTNDQVIPDDLIVQGSGCFGFDCVNNESFGFDTIRLKENNLRIKFEDTSVGSFPTNDWQLTANDSASGGSSKFSIEDITGVKVPFTITAGATTNSIFVDSTGRVGFRTSTPVLDLHVATSNTPAIRLEQNSSGGFSAQTWDIAGNEANFFVRDVTSGSRLPFRIRPGAPTSSIDISADGDVGVGTASPDYLLHVLDSGATDNTVLQIENNGPTRMRILNGSSGETWNLGHQSPSGTGFVVSDVGDAVTEMALDTAGNMTISGNLTQGSSRAIKTGIESVDTAAALETVRNLPISLWTYKEGDNARHVGPMAEEFHAAFGLGADDKHIAPGDQAGVALAAIQGLANVVQEKDARIQQLEAQIQALTKAVEELKAQR